VADLRFGAHLDAGDVFHPDNRTAGIRAQDDRGEFLRARKPALGLDVDLDLLFIGDGRSAHPAEGRLNILALDRRDDVVRRQTEFGQPVGIEPDPQRIVERSEESCLADAIDPRQRVDDVDGRIVAQINRIVGALRRIDVDDLQKGGEFLADAQAIARHLLRQLRRGETGIVLHIDGVDVRVGAQREGHVECVAAVGPAGGLIIERIVNAVDLLLDRLRHRGLDHFGIRAWIGRGQRDLRRHDIRELRDRNRRDGNDAGQGDDDGDDEGKPRPVDEDGGKHCLSFLARGSPSRLDRDAPFVSPRQSPVLAP
jgi:hypothetical protein